MKRYQNPDVFEPLAMAYALGTLQGRARARFEQLMVRHFYLRVVTEAYEQQFAGLVDLLPSEAPSAAVWQRLETELGLEQAAGKVAAKPAKQAPKWLAWSEWFHWPAMAFASVLAAVLTVLIMNNVEPDAYVARLESVTAERFALASVSKKEMAIKVAMAGELEMDEGLQPTLWCLSKKPGEKPIRMGVLNASGQTQLPINADTFRGLGEVSRLLITLEPVGQADVVEPAGAKILAGDLLQGRE